MRIASFQPCSLNEYPGYISSIVFTQGCNFNCFFCHNPELKKMRIPSTLSNLDLLAEEDVINDIHELRGKIEGVSISGGEPLVQRGLIPFMKKIKDCGFLIKLNTNGSIYSPLEEAISKDLVDFVDMDIKAPLEKYEEVIGRHRTSYKLPTYWNKKEINKSIALLKNSKIPHVFSVVKHSKLSETDVERIFDWIGYKNLEIRESLT